MRKMTLVLVLCVLLSALPMTAGAYDTEGTYGALTYRIDNGKAEIASCDPSAEGRIEIPSFIDGKPVTGVEMTAFDKCEQLKCLVIPETVQYFNSLLYYCSSLEAIEVAEDNEWYCSVDGVLFNKDQTIIRCYPPAKKGAYVIPDGVTQIWSAFDRCRFLTEITIPASVVKCDNDPFNKCASLKTIRVSPDNPVYMVEDGILRTREDRMIVACPAMDSLYIDKDTLVPINDRMGCSEVKRVEFSDDCDPNVIWKNYGSMGLSTFQGCEKLETVVLGDSCTSIGTSMFSGCSNLKTIYLPAKLVTGYDIVIDTMAFFQCDSLTDVYFSGTQEEWNQILAHSSDYHNECLFEANIHCNHAHSWDGGRVVKAPTETEDGLVAFSCRECTKTRFEKLKAGCVFLDVAADAYYAGPVSWAAKNQITSGTDATHFSPNATCTRGQVVTFLWRAKGSPEPESDHNPFSDVSSKAYYYKAVLWANENGITSGTSATTFSPESPCTRAHVVTFLWRSENQPKAGNSNPFRDVLSGQYFTDAVVWAVEKNITNGTDATHFSPASPCTRGQIVTFLYRDIAS